MSESRNYGVLRVIGVKRAYHVKKVRKAREEESSEEMRREKYTDNRALEEHPVHLLTRRETTIGRALDNDVILLDPLVSREHARLVLDEQGWSIYNLTTNNIVSVNGRPVPVGEQLALHPQDFVQIGGTLLQLVAPTATISDEATAVPSEATAVSLETVTPLRLFLPSRFRTANGHNGHMRSEDEAGDEYLLSMEATPGCPGEAAMVEQTWHREEEMWKGGEITLRFALAQRLGVSMRWVLIVTGLVLLAICVVGAIALNNSGSFSIIVQQDGMLGLLGALTIPLIPALGITLLSDFIDRFEREPWYLRLAAFLWGAIIAVPSAAFIGQFFDQLITSTWGASGNIGLHALLQGLNSGVTEETLKGLGVLLLFMVLRDEFDNVTDGIVYGALIGAGFAMVENFFYFADNQADWPVLIVGRIVLGWLCHSTFTVCFGAALGYIRHTRVRWQHIVIPLLGYLLAVGLHTVFDFVNGFVKELVPAVGVNNPTVLTISLIAVVANYIPPFITQLVILYVLMKSLAHEAAIIRDFLAPEVCTGVITVDEYALLQSSVVRVRVERRVLLQQGIKQWWRVKELYQTEIGLAFRKWHVSMGDEPKLGYVQPEDAYRRRIKRLRQEIQASEK